LPRHVGAADGALPAPEAAEAASGRRGEAILLVEDDEDVRRYGVALLGELGYRVLAASDGATALGLLGSDPGIRLLFTDVGLPGGMNGRELALEAQRRHPGLKVLFTTGYAQSAVVVDGRLTAGIELIVKPFTSATLAEEVRRALDDGGARAGAMS
jgi:CheY-like chemotaxis protein